MKKIITIFSMMILFLFPQYVNATIGEDEVALGGLSVRSDISTAVNIYGQPDRIHGQSYYWGNGFEVRADNHNKISWIETTADNGISTPSNLKVGSSVNDLYKIYGRPDYSWVELQGSAYVYKYEGGWNTLIFTAQNDKIIKIVATKNIR